MNNDKWIKVTQRHTYGNSSSSVLIRVSDIDSIDGDVIYMHSKSGIWKIKVKDTPGELLKKLNGGNNDE